MRNVGPRTMVAGGCVLLALVCTHRPSVVLSQVSSRPRSEAILINTHVAAHPFPHYWEEMFGSGRAILSLRQSYRLDLRSVRKVTDLRYVRFHGIFDRDVGLYHVNKQGQPEYNFSYVDQIYDGLLANGVCPYVELSFMPEGLASSPEQQSFWYHPYISPPKNWNLWSDLVRRFAQHLVARYGLREVSQWYFEVWNEPNIGFWAGKPKQSTYFQLYDAAARALKGVNSSLRVGGPATAQVGWIVAFINHCVRDRVPVDFVSTHVYGDDTAENVFGTHKPISRRDMVSLAVKKVHDEVKASQLPNLPIIFSEYNASYMNIVDVTDSPFMGPWLAETISRCDGLVNMLSYWDFSDVFEEQGVVKKPFYGGYGLVATGNIPKASYNDFALLHRLGTRRLTEQRGPFIVTQRSDGTIAIALWNYAPPGNGGNPRTYNLSFRGLRGAHRALIWIVDGNHGSPLATWEAMGKPGFPSRGQEAILRRAARLPQPTIQMIPVDNQVLTLRLAPHALALIDLTK